MHKKYALLTACVGAVAGILPRQAIAQAVDSAPERIEITARKRAEPLQEVPIAGKTFSAAALADEAINSNQSLLVRTASASTVELGAAFAGEIILRGSGSGRVINGETPTGLYRNGAYASGGNIAGRAFNKFDFFDVERIEVLRGPQAALLGRGAVGGAINVINVKPQATQSRSATISVGSNSAVGFEGIVNVPLSDQLNMRLGVVSNHSRGGSFTDQATGDPLDGERLDGARLALAFDGGKSFRYNLMVDGYKAGVPSFGVFAFVLGRDRFQRNFNTPTFANHREGTAIGEGTWQLDNGATVVALTQVKRRAGATSDDFDAYANLSSVPGLSSWQRLSDDSFRRFGQELRIQSADGLRLTWLAGVEVLTLKDVFTTDMNGATGARRPLNSLFTTYSDDTSMSVFGAMGFDITPEWALAGELRQQRDHKKFQLDTITYTFPTGTTAQAQATGPVTTTRLIQDFDRTFNGLAKVVSLTYKASKTFTGYARYGQAFRPGGFNPDPDRNTATSTPPGPRFDIPYEQEDAKTLEFGAKTEWFGRALRINLAAYRTRIDDIQITNTINTTPPGSSTSRSLVYLLNGGNAQIDGIEFDAHLEIAAPGPDGRFIVDASGNYTDPAFVSGQFTGSNVPQTRPRSGTLGLTYQSRPFGLTRAFVNLNYQTLRGGFQRYNNAAPMDQVNTLNANIGVRGRNWFATLNVSNVTNDMYVTNYNDLALTTGYTNLPRSWSLKTGVTF